MIYNGLKARAFNIVVSLYLSPDQVQDIYLKVLYDNPLFYYINQTVIRMAGEPGYYVLSTTMKPNEILHILGGKNLEEDEEN